MDVKIIHNDYSIVHNIDIDKSIGSIQEKILSLIHLMIYNIEYSLICFNDKEFILGINELSFHDILKDFLINNNYEKIDCIKIIDRKRDNEGNVIKENLVIDKYNYWFQQKETNDYIQSFNNRMRNFNQINNMFLQSFTFQNQDLNTENNIRNSLNLFVNNFINSLDNQTNNQNNSETNNQNNSETNNQNNSETTNQNNNLENINTSFDDEENNIINNNLENINTSFDDEGNNIINNNLENINTSFDDEGNNIINNNLENINTNLENEENNQNNIFDTNILHTINNNIQQRLNNLNQNNINNNLNQNNINNIQTIYNNPINENSRINDIHFINNIINNINQNFDNSNLFYFNQNNTNIQETVHEDVIIALTDDEFKEIKSIDYKDLTKEDTKCNICLECFKKENKILELKCGHIFDYDCIENWLKNHSNKCPICRIEINKGQPINL